MFSAFPLTPKTRLALILSNVFCLSNGNQYVIAFMTKWPVIFAVPNQTIATTAHLLVEKLEAATQTNEKLSCQV